jgi:serine/threonine protein kinase
VAELAAGTTIHGYRIDRHIGRGGMGDVHLAHHAESNRWVALKSMHEAAAANDEFRKRFRREARAAMAVHHPNVVKVHEIFENDGVPYIAMEYLEGESLEERMTREGALPLRLVARLMVRVTSAVGTAHAMGIVHRDLKPENIFLVGDAADPDVKVLDFGIAKLTATEGAAAETAALTKTGMLMGTPYYMSPEQAFGDKTIDQRSDVWALGIILYRALSGVLPTKAAGFGEVFRLVVKVDPEPLEKLVPGLPPDVSRLAVAMLQKSRDKRPWDLRECHDVLRGHAEAAEIEDVPTFGIAVTPIWDEASTDTRAPTGLGDSSATAARDALATTPGGSKPLALTPGALRRGPSPVVGEGGTVALSAADVARQSAPLSHPASRPAAQDDGAATLLLARPATAPTLIDAAAPPRTFASEPPGAIAGAKSRSFVPIVGFVCLLAIALVTWRFFLH